MSNRDNNEHASPASDFEAFAPHEQNFCDECGEHLMKHENGCPDSRNEFMLEVKRRKAAKYVKQ